MPFVTSDDIRTEQEALAERVHKLQEALDHVHAVERVLDPDEHQILYNAAFLRISLTAARIATSDRIKFNEGLLARVLREEATA